MPEGAALGVTLAIAFLQVLPAYHGCPVDPYTPHDLECYALSNVNPLATTVHTPDFPLRDFMLTEKDAIYAVPPSGFIHDYVVHAVKQTTSPLCYHLGVGLSILSCTCPLDYGMHYAGKLRANMFALLLTIISNEKNQKTDAFLIPQTVFTL